MKTFSQQEVLERYDTLPQALKEAIFSDSNTEKILSIGRKNGLLLDKVGILAAETGYVMVGLTHPHDFPARLSEAFAIAPIKANEIAADVSEQIFKPIREHILASERDGDAPMQPKKPQSFAPPKPSAKPSDSSFVAPMIFPENKGTPPPTSSDIPTIKKMPLEPSGSWKPPQPITPVFDQMRKSNQAAQQKPDQIAQKLDPYHESFGSEVTPPPPGPIPLIKKVVEPPPPTPIPPPDLNKKQIPPAPKFIDTLNTSFKDPSIEKIPLITPSLDATPVMKAPSTDSIKKEVSDILSKSVSVTPPAQEKPQPTSATETKPLAESIVVPIPQPPSPNINLDTKLSEFNVPKPEEPKTPIEIKPKPVSSPIPPPAAPQTPTAPKPKIEVPKYGSNDPYHEPVI